MDDTIDPAIFREYDIRGQAIKLKASDRLTLTPEGMRAIGRVLGSRHQAGQTALVTGDNRKSTPALSQGVAEGLQQAGLSVDLADEEVPTGAASWLALANTWCVVVQVTGSHTAPHFNGLKITERQVDGKPSDVAAAVPAAVFGRSLEAVRDEVVADRWRRDAKPGTITKVTGLVAQYRDALVRSTRELLGQEKFATHRRVVLDAGNGLGFHLGPILESLGADVQGLFLESDGTFPNHPPDPLLADRGADYRESGVRFACERVEMLNTSQDGAPWFGIVTDGDGDRSGVVDETGRPVRPELLGMLFYQEYLHGHAEALSLLRSRGQRLFVAGDVRGTGVFYSMFSKVEGVEPRFIPAGYPIHRAFARSQIRQLLAWAALPENSDRERELLLGLARDYVSAEISGHFFFSVKAEFPDIVVDDGLVSALRLLAILDRHTPSGPDRRKPLAALLGRYPTRFTSEEIRLSCPDAEKFKIVETSKAEAMRRFSGRLGPIQPKENIGGVVTQDMRSGLVDIDGVRVQFHDESFFLIRASNTSPYLTFRFEGLTDEALKARCRDAYDLLKPFEASVGDLESLLRI